MCQHLHRYIIYLVAAKLKQNQSKSVNVIVFVVGVVAMSKHIWINILAILLCQIAAFALKPQELWIILMLGMLAITIAVSK